MFMKFPKDEVRYKEQAKDLWKRRDYDLLWNTYHPYDDAIFDANNQIVQMALLETYFFKKEFLLAMELGRKIIVKKQDIPRTITLVYLSSVALGDIVSGWIVGKISKVMEAEENKSYTEDDGANYSNITTLLEVDFDRAMMLFFHTWMRGLIKEEANNTKMDKMHYFIRYMDLMNIAFELGYNDKTIASLEKIREIIFDLESFDS